MWNPFRKKNSGKTTCILSVKYEDFKVGCVLVSTVLKDFNGDILHDYGRTWLSLTEKLELVGVTIDWVILPDGRRMYL